MLTDVTTLQVQGSEILAHNQPSANPPLRHQKCTQPTRAQLEYMSSAVVWQTPHTNHDTQPQQSAIAADIMPTAL